MTGYARTTADVEGDFVVLIIGTKVHRWREFDHYFGGASAVGQGGAAGDPRRGGVGLVL